VIWLASLIFSSMGLLLLAIDTLGMNLDCLAEDCKARTELSLIGAITAAVGLSAAALASGLLS
jgi:hypothetical protein